MAPSAFHLLCAKQQAERGTPHRGGHFNEGESPSGFPQSSFTSGTTRACGDLETVLKEQLEMFIRGPLETLIRDAISNALNICMKEGVELKPGNIAAGCVAMPVPLPPSPIRPPYHLRDGIRTGFVKPVELPSMPPQLLNVPSVSMTIPHAVPSDDTETDSDSGTEVLEDGAFTMQKATLKIFTEGEETRFNAHKRRPSMIKAPAASARRAAIRHSQRSATGSDNPPMQPVAEDNAQEGEDVVTTASGTIRSGRLSEADALFKQARKQLEMEKLWLCALRADSSRDALHLNDPDIYDDLPEWRSARTCWFWRGEIWLWEKCAKMVCNVKFDYLSALFILANSVVVGANTDFVAKNLEAELPGSFRVFDLLFCAVFTNELILKLFVHRLNFYFLADYKWNVFDTILVCMQLFEEILAAVVGTAETAPPPSNSQLTDAEAAEQAEQSSGIGMNFSFMRVLRILRLVRIVRLFRVLRVIGELRTIVASIIGCLKPLVSAMLLLLLMIYVVGVFFTQAVSTHLLEDPSAEPNPALKENFGSLAQSLFSLFQCVLGGMDWGDVANPLTHEMSTVYGLVFAFYIIFAVLAMMNVMTGVFVEAALAISKRDEEVYMVNHMKQLLKITDVDDSGEVSWEEFQAQLDNPDMLEYFKCIDVDPSEGQNLFNILDVEETGSLDAAQFVSGCLKLRGPARALDLEIFSNHTRKAIAKSLDNQKRLVHMLQGLTKQLTAPKGRH
eukprot:TRINITY_DN1586_c0_g1_i1.p1 TRINITY_DN1586_c0_g1~~TRINITY_DN1586_c0_g1_i1.p1  ORF type:complete len:731 (-),score=114.70 TRINITY_DN1586_c0_g1_i1:429-2621(-)